MIGSGADGAVIRIKIWVITVKMMKVLEAFHHRITRRIMGKTNWCIGVED